MRPNTRSNAWKNLPSSSYVRCLSSSAHSAGVSVSATMPDSTTEITMVAANCLYIAPVMPPTKATGIKTAHNTSTMATRALPTCFIARFVATRGETPSCSMIRSTFSITTMASSTTIPMASTRPNNVRVLIVKPSACNPRNVPMIETGTASTGMSVARQLLRNRNTTSVTRNMASNNVFTTSLMDAVMNGVVSKGIS